MESTERKMKCVQLNSFCFVAVFTSKTATTQ